MKSHKKLLSLVMAVMFCITFLAPVLMAPAQAQAAVTYSVIRTASVSAVGDVVNTTIQVDIPNVAALKYDDIMTIHFPSSMFMNNPHVNQAIGHTGVYKWESRSDIMVGMMASSLDRSGSSTAPTGVYQVYKVTTPTLGGNFIDYGVYAQTAGGTEPWLTTLAPDVIVEIPNKLGTTEANILDNFTASGTSHPGGNMYTGPIVAYAVGDTTLEIRYTGATSPTGAGRFYIKTQGMTLRDIIDGDISATIIAPSTSGFSSGGVVLGKCSASGVKSTTSLAKTVKTMGTSVTTMDTIMVQENNKGSIAAGEIIKLKLPPGFKWTAPANNPLGLPCGIVVPSWGFNGLANKVTAIGTDTRELLFTMWGATAGILPSTSEGRLYFGQQATGDSGWMAIVVDDEAVAKKGNVDVTISSNNNGVTEQTITIAEYKDYVTEVKGKTVKENVVAGWMDSELGSFQVIENIQGSILPGRNITFTLPTGVKWDSYSYPTLGSLMTRVVNTGSDFTNAGTWSLDSSKKVLKLSLANATWNKSDVTFEKLRVAISPAYTGDIELEVGGTAGVAGKVKVGTVVAPVAVTADAVKDVIIGVQGQALADVVIKESKKEAINAGASSKDVILTLPLGARFSATPTVAVTEGDCAIDKVTLSNNDRSTKIQMKSTSATPASLKVSGIKVTVDRTVPEGDFKLSLGADSTSIASADLVRIFNIDEISSLLVAKVITPAPNQTVANTSANGSFTIGSNVMMVNGQYKILDAAPYVKSGRTYVPVRDLGEALGASINWDAATQTVTITKGDKTVVLVIGNAVAKVNGADVTMDVAPEISNGRTMLPARYVAEGLGYKVEWNAAAQQVVFGS